LASKIHRNSMMPFFESSRPVGNVSFSWMGSSFAARVVLGS
jgi:hypothetical protein